MLMLLPLVAAVAVPSADLGGRHDGVVTAEALETLVEELGVDVGGGGVEVVGREEGEVRVLHLLVPGCGVCVLRDTRSSFRERGFPLRRSPRGAARARPVPARDGSVAAAFRAATPSRPPP